MGSYVDVGPGGLARDLDPIGQRRSGGVSPARATVLRNVLVADICQVIRAVDVVPLPLGGQVIHRRQRSLDHGRRSILAADRARRVRRDSATFGEGHSSKKGANSKRSHFNI